jgi:hypothetical protein
MITEAHFFNVGTFFYEMDMWSEQSLWISEDVLGYYFTLSRDSFRQSGIMRDIIGFPWISLDSMLFYKYRIPTHEWCSSCTCPEWIAAERCMARGPQLSS